MKGKIFLSGGGDLEEAKTLDGKFFDCLDNGSKILYIPVALNRDRLGFEACYDWFSNIISYHAVNKEVDFSMVLMEDDVPSLEKYDAIYIGGGNTFKLLDYIIKKKIDSKIKTYIENGGIVYGGSAGAIIFGKDIRTVSEENDNNYKHSKGLGYLKEVSLICHYESKLDDKIFNSLNELGESIIALPEDSGLIISNDGMEVVGNPLIFNDKIKKKFE